MKLGRNTKRAKSNNSLPRVIVNNLYNNNFQLNYQKRINKKNISKETENTNNREFGTELPTNCHKNKKRIKYPKDNTIRTIDVNSKPKKKEGKRKKKIPNKSTIDKIINTIHHLSFDENEEGLFNVNKNNPLNEYIKEIMSNLMKDELINRPDYSKFPKLFHKDNNATITYLKRFSFINFFILFQQELPLSQETFYLCLNLFDRYIEKTRSEKKKNLDLNLIALTCIFIAAKYEEIYPPKLKNFLYIFRNSYIKRDIYLKEEEILSKLNFDILTISPYLFLSKFCFYDNFSYTESKYDKELCFQCAQFLLELFLIEPLFCQMKPSLQAATCIYLSRKLLKYDKRMNNVWNNELTYITSYDEVNIKENIEIALKVLKNFFGNYYTKNFSSMAIYTKFSTLAHLEVSVKIKETIFGE